MTTKFSTTYMRNARKNAVRFLEDLLKGGPVKAQAVIDAARQAGIAEVTLKRAKRQIGIMSKKDPTYRGGWLWELPVSNDDQKVKSVREEDQPLKKISKGDHPNKNDLLQEDTQNTSTDKYILREGGQEYQSVRGTSNVSNYRSWLWGRCSNCGIEKYITKPCEYCERAAAKFPT
jgi:hypothetical protein